MLLGYHRVSFRTDHNASKNWPDDIQSSKVVGEKGGGEYLLSLLSQTELE